MTVTKTKKKMVKSLCYEFLTTQTKIIIYKKESFKVGGQLFLSLQQTAPCSLKRTVKIPIVTRSVCKVMAWKEILGRKWD